MSSTLLADILSAEHDPDVFFILGMHMVKKRSAATKTIPFNDTNLRLFKQNFGVAPIVLSKCWSLLLDQLRQDHTNCYNASLASMHPKHLLWACLFLKTYGKEGTHCAIARCDPKTFRRWVWIVVRAIATTESHVVSVI